MTSTEPPLRVLVVEDESLLAMLIEDVLAGEGWEVVASAATVAEALAAVEQGGFDVALLDVNVAGEEMFPVAEALLRRELPLLFASGYGSHGVRRDLRHLPVIAKPFHPAALVEALRAAVAEHAGQDPR